jgi:CubicO group peptidase (beta-lactamase class C family)
MSVCSPATKSAPPATDTMRYNSDRHGAEQDRRDLGHAGIKGASRAEYGEQAEPDCIDSVDDSARHNRSEHRHDDGCDEAGREQAGVVERKNLPTDEHVADDAARKPVDDGQRCQPNDVHTVSSGHIGAAVGERPNRDNLDNTLQRHAHVIILFETRSRRYSRTTTMSVSADGEVPFTPKICIDGISPRADLDSAPWWMRHAPRLSRVSSMFPRRLPTALLALVVVAAACGSDGDRSKSSTSTTTSVVAANPTTTTSTPPSTTAVAAATSSPSTSTTVNTSENDAAAQATRSLFTSIGPDQPGCTVAVRRGKNVIFAEAYGAASISPTTPMTTKTVVDIGSTSKQFTASAVLLLAERGQVDLQKPVRQYLPGLPPWAGTVTVDQMVHHTSGIPDYIELLVTSGVSLQDVATDDMALAALGKVTELNFAPATSWEYSNSNYFLLGQIVLAVTGDDLGAFLAREVFTPLRMDAVMDPTRTIPSKANSYGRDGDRWVNADSPWQQLGDGAIQTTPSELLKWASEYWEPTIGPKDVNTKRFASASKTDEDNRYGFGIMESVVDGRRILEHSGGWGGFVTSFVVDPVAQVAVAATCAAPESIPTALESSTHVLDFWI